MRADRAKMLQQTARELHEAEAELRAPQGVQTPDIQERGKRYVEAIHQHRIALKVAMNEEGLPG